MFKLVEELQVEDTAEYKEMLWTNCETFEKTADQITIMNYHTHSQTGKTIDYHEEFEQAQSDS